MHPVHNRAVLVVKLKIQSMYEYNINEFAKRFCLIFLSNGVFTSSNYNDTWIQ